MSRLMRWVRFNFVGMIGAVAQLSALAILNRSMPGHYLLATAAAIEITLLHNFAWHVRYTWSDRRLGRLFGTLLRFHFSNGLVSMAGNLVLMRVLVQQLHLRVLGADGIAIVCCSIVNFILGDAWVFCANHKSCTQPRTSRLTSLSDG